MPFLLIVVSTSSSCCCCTSPFNEFYSGASQLGYDCTWLLLCWDVLCIQASVFWLHGNANCLHSDVQVHLVHQQGHWEPMTSTRHPSHCRGNHPKMMVDLHSLSMCLSAVSLLAPPGPKWRAFHRMSWPMRPPTWMKPLTTISVSVPRTNTESAPLLRQSRLSSPRANLVSMF